MSQDNMTSLCASALADAMLNLGILSEHMRQAKLNEADPEAAALHRRAAVQHARSVATLTSGVTKGRSDFIAAAEPAPRIVRG